MKIGDVGTFFGLNGQLTGKIWETQNFGWLFIETDQGVRILKI